MGAASERDAQVVLEDGLRKRKEGEADNEKSGSAIIPSTRVTPLSQVWRPSPRAQNTTGWILLVVTIFFSLAVVVEELQASWYRSPALNALNSQFHGAESLDRVLKPTPRNAPNILRLEWGISKGVRSPNGIASNVYLINGELIGPVVEARPGDVILLDLVNLLDEEEVEIQFFEDLGSDKRSFWQGLSSPQKALVAAGETQQYEIRAPKDKSGTFMYRARDQKQAAGGLFGAFIVHDALPRLSPQSSVVTGPGTGTEEERLITINEWQPFTADRAGQISQPTIAPSILLNGIGNYNCSQLDPASKINCKEKTSRGQPTMLFTAHKKYRLRIINTSTTSGITISIPGTIMTIIEINSGWKVQPKRATSIGVMRPGQTLDVEVEWSAAGDDEFVVNLEDDIGDGAIVQSFPISVSGFLDSRVRPPVHRYRDILRLKPLET